MCLQYSSSLHTCAFTVSCTQKREIGWTLKKESWNNWGDRKICLETTIGCRVVDCKTNTAQYWTRCPWWCWPQLWHIWLSVWILNIISGQRSFAKYYFWKGEGSLNFVLSRLWPLALPSSLLVPLVWATEPTIAINVGIVSRWMGAFLNWPYVSQYSICWTMFSQKAHYSIHSSTSAPSAISCHSELHIFIKNEWGFIMSCSCASWASSELQHLSTVDTLSALSWPSTDCCFLSASRRPSDAYPVVPSTTTTFTISHSTSLLVVCTHTPTVWINNSQSRLAQAVPWHAWHQSGNVKTLCTTVLGTHAQWQVTPSAGMPSLPTTPTLLCGLTAARDYWTATCSQRSDSQLCNARVVVYLPGNWLKSLGSALLYLCRPLVFITGKTAI